MAYEEGYTHTRVGRGAQGIVYESRAEDIGGTPGIGDRGIGHRRVGVGHTGNLRYPLDLDLHAVVRFELRGLVAP
eukprot:3027228-Rhodomonas_salina.2